MMFDLQEWDEYAQTWDSLGQATTEGWQLKNMGELLAAKFPTARYRVIQIIWES